MGLHFLEARENSKVRVDGQADHLEQAKNVGIGSNDAQPPLTSNPMQRRKQATYSTAVDIGTVGQLKEKTLSVVAERFLSLLREERDRSVVEIPSQAQKRDTTKRVRDDFQHVSPSFLNRKLTTLDQAILPTRGRTDQMTRDF